VLATLRENVPLAPFTTLGIGGPARYFRHVENEQTLREVIDFAKSRNVPLFVLGGGSNLLIADAGYPGMVARIEIRGSQWMDEGERVRLIAGAGEDWDSVVAACIGRGLYGVECLSGIPGSVGGTPVQNVGAYGQEISETLLRVRAYDRQTDRVVELDRSECGFTYRTSVFNTVALNRYIVLAVEYGLAKQGQPAVRYPDVQRELDGVANPALPMVRNAVLRIRSSKAMVLQAGDPDCRSAGSFFKNPIVTEATYERIQSSTEEKVPRYPAPAGMVKTAAAWLIERAGISKGFSLGAAGVSRKHTLALINKGGATAADVIALAREIRKRVEDRFGIRLCVEPMLIGFDEDLAAEFRQDHGRPLES
jgi:UDP-N-acetylmuramate dehydrogenase